MTKKYMKYSEKTILNQKEINNMNPNNKFIQGLYDAAKSDTIDNKTGLPKMDEQKLRRYLDANDRLMRNNRDIFEEKEIKYKTCPRYLPCPICSKCQNKASHLYVACETCSIPICSHTYADRHKMIKRNNFTIYVDNDTMDIIKEIDSIVTGGDING